MNVSFVELKPTKNGYYVNRLLMVVTGYVDKKISVYDLLYLDLTFRKHIYFVELKSAENGFLLKSTLGGFGGPVPYKTLVEEEVEVVQMITKYRTLNCNKTTMYYSIDMDFFYSKDNLVALHFKYDQARRRFVEWAQNEIAIAPDFHKRILFSDEAHFWLNGYVNKQNCRIWSEANPQVYVETPLHPEKLTVWCA
ncbi:hypothetical protein TNCV_2082211 [Trichonephila clavipes]|nr:hypothetical protein TNCV_2082211 [Trichonephila clavipes]